MGLGELLDTAFALYRTNFVLIASITAVLSIPSAVIQYAIARDATLGQGSPPSAFASVAVAGLIDFLLVQPLIQAAVTRAVSDRYLERPVTVGSSYRSALGRLRSLIAMSIELILVTMALLVPPIVLASQGGDRSGRAAVLVLLLVPALLVWLWVIVRLAFAAPAIVIEAVSGWRGIRRSWALTRGSWWRVFGILVLISLVVGAAGAVITGVVSAPGTALGTSGRIAYTSAATAIVNVFVMPIRLIAVTLLYYDLRIRREAFDIEMLAASL